MLRLAVNNPMPMSALGRRLVPCVALMLLSGVSATAYADELDDLSQRVATARQNLGEIQRLYLEPALIEAQFKLEARLQEGQVLLDGGDPERAAVLFLDIVMREEWQNEPGYRAAQFYLAQALYNAGYYATARTRAIEVLEKGRGEDYQAALTLLIQIGIETGNWTGIDDIFAQLERNQAAQIQPELLYARGKGLYVEGRYDEAIDILSRIDPSSVAGVKARYFLGVLHARKGLLDEAEADFVAVIGHKDNSDPIVVDIVELAYLAKGRIHYERQQWPEAIDTYSNIPRQSRHFDQSLFEITWTHIRNGEPTLALRNLEILLIAKPDSVFIPDARRLTADLQKDVGEFEKALDTYETILSEFEPVLAELDGMVAGQSDPLRYFQHLVEKDDYGRADYLPSTARQWVPLDDDMAEASSMVGSLGQSFENTQECDALIAEISAAVESSNRYELFGDLRGAWVASLELEGALLGIRRDANDLQLAEVGDPGAAHQERLAQEQAFEAIPDTREAYMDRERLMADALEARSLDSYRVRTAIDGVQAQIDAIQRWLVVDGDESSISAEERDALQAELITLEAEVEALQKEMRDVEREIRVQTSLGGDSSLATDEAETRKAYRLALLREAEALAASGSFSESGRLGKLETELAALDAEIESYRGQIVALVDGRISDVRRRLQAEEAVLEQAKVRYDQLHGDVELVAGEIAYQYWQRAQSLFSDLVLGAEIGLVDVSWLKKDELSRTIETLLEERSKERDILGQDFNQIRKELGEEDAK